MQKPGTHHIAALDGVRGFAVILVLLFHFGLLPVGWVGVQLFFVLSGYLITRILLDGRRHPLAFSLKRFYWRRSLRILPVYLLFLAIVLLTFLVAKVPQSLPADWPWLVSFSANLGRLRPSDIGEPFVHMWSLAVEEQFYLIWPFAVLMLPMRQLKRFIWLLLLGAPMLRLATFWWLQNAGFDPDYAGRVVYVLPFTQFDAFAAGAVFAVWPALISRVTVSMLLATTALIGACGVAVLAIEHLNGNGAYWLSLGYEMYLVAAGGYAWAYTLLNVLFAILIAASIRGFVLTRPFGTAPMKFMGRISYGLYVYHLPLLLVVRHFYPSPTTQTYSLTNLAVFAAWAGVSVLAAFVSYQLIESPILGLKDRAFRTYRSGSR